MDADKLPSCIYILVINLFIIVLIIGFGAPIAIRDNQKPYNDHFILIFSLIFLFEVIFFALYVTRETE